MQVKIAPTLLSVLRESFPILGESFPQDVSEAIISEKGIAFSIKNSSIFVSCKFDFNVLISGAKKETATSSHETSESTKSKKAKRDNHPLSWRWHNLMKLAEENGEWYKCLQALIDDGHVITRTRSVIHKDGKPCPAWYFLLLPRKIERVNKKGEENHLPSNVRNFYLIKEKEYVLKDSMVELTFKSVRQNFDATNNLLAEGLMKRANCTLPLTPDEIEEVKKAKEHKVEESVTEQSPKAEVDPEPTSEPESSQSSSEQAPIQESTQEPSEAADNVQTSEEDQ